MVPCTFPLFFLRSFPSNHNNYLLKELQTGGNGRAPKPLFEIKCKMLYSFGIDLPVVHFLSLGKKKKNRKKKTSKQTEKSILKV